MKQSITLIACASAALALPARAQFELQKVVPNELSSFMSFGETVAISGTRAIVGARTAFDFDGRAYIYDLGPSGWFEVADLATDDPTASYFGRSVAISGDRAAVGAPNHSIYIYERTPTGWVETDTVSPDVIVADDLFGLDIVLQGDTLVVGARGDSNRRGAVYLFQLEATGWVQKQKLVASDATLQDEFGQAVDLSGNTLIVGAWKDNPPGVPNTGSVYIFEESGGLSSETQKLTASDQGPLHFFGRDVALDGDAAIISTEVDKAYLFSRVGSTWVEGEHLVPIDGPQGGPLFFGTSVSLSGDWAMVGAPYADFTEEYVGVAYLYRRLPTGWQQVNRWVASDAVPGDRLGNSVAVGSIAAVVGAYQSGVPEHVGRAFFFALQELAAEPYCFCPAGVDICGNPDEEAGCVNSTGKGARAGAVGSSSIARDNLALVAWKLPSHQFGIFYMGAGQTDLPFGDGRRCVDAGGVGTFRFPVQNTGPAGELILGPDIVLYSTTQFSAGGHISAGQTWNFQAWFRDPTGPCGSSFNLSNGVSIAFAP